MVPEAALLTMAADLSPPAPRVLRENSIYKRSVGRSVGQARDPGNGGGVDRRSPAESPERRCRGNDRAAIANSSVNIPSGRYLAARIYTVAADGVAFRFETLYRVVNNSYESRLI